MLFTNDDKKKKPALWRVLYSVFDIDYSAAATSVSAILFS